MGESFVRAIATALFVLAGTVPGLAEDLSVTRGITGRAGGTLVYAQRNEPKTLNPLTAGDAYSREVIPRLMADLIHINRHSQQTEPALAKSWTLSADGRVFTLELREGVRFSDGHPFDADDVMFTFQVYLDAKVNAAQRDQLRPGGKPVIVRKLGPHRVSFELPQANAVAERLFDGFYILPRHLMAKAFEQGKLREAWSLRAAPAEVAGLGPFRLKEYAEGRRLVLERNPYYWKTDEAGVRLPYLAELHFVFAGSEDTQVLRFQSGESDILNRVSARNYGVLAKAARRRGYRLENLGPGLEYNSLVFNLNDASRTPARLSRRLAFLQRQAFRAAVSAAIDREAMVRLIYQGFATPLASLVPPGNRRWLPPEQPRPARDLKRARRLLTADGFTWAADGQLVDPQGTRVEFTIAVSSSNPERQQMATLIQDDLRALGIAAQVAPLEFRSLLDRVQKSFDFETCVLALGSADADPNSELNVWVSSGNNHLWHVAQQAPASAWEAEIDGLMLRQAVTVKYPERKRLFDRVQQILSEQLPMVPLVSPNVLVGARDGLANFRAAVLDHSTLWNVEELSWRDPAGSGRR